MRADAVIMVVDDDALDVQAFERALARTGRTHPLRFASDGRQALDYLTRDGPYAREDPGDLPRPALIFLDLRMPRMSGVEFLAAKREIPSIAAIPTVVLTTSNRESEREACYRLGASGYLRKPGDDARFSASLNTVLDYWRLCE